MQAGVLALRAALAYQEGMPVERVLLIHGLWLRGLTLGPLGRRLRAAGYAPQAIDYASVLHGPERAAQEVMDILSRCDGPTHLVGHSLGGLVALRALSMSAEHCVGRVVCLGSPLAGSAAARGLGRFPLAPRMMGRSRRLLAEGIGSVEGRVEVGSIAGTRALGLGRFFGRMQGPSDGTVAVDETRVPGLADHCTVHASHTGLILSRHAARLTVAFLREGHFGGCATGAEAAGAL